MKLTRRKFFAGLAVAPLVAVAVAKAMPVLADNSTLILARWTKMMMLPDWTYFVQMDGSIHVIDHQELRWRFGNMPLRQTTAIRREIASRLRIRGNHGED